MLINQDEWNCVIEVQKVLVEVFCIVVMICGLVEGEYKNGKVLVEFQDKGVQVDQILCEVLFKL